MNKKNVKKVWIKSKLVWRKKTPEGGPLSCLFHFCFNCSSLIVSPLSHFYEPTFEENAECLCLGGGCLTDSVFEVSVFFGIWEISLFESQMD